MYFEGHLFLHVWKPKSFSFVDLGLLKVHVVECHADLNSFKSRMTATMTVVHSMFFNTF